MRRGCVYPDKSAVERLLTRLEACLEGQESSVAYNAVCNLLGKVLMHHEEPTLLLGAAVIGLSSFLIMNHGTGEVFLAAKMEGESDVEPDKSTH